MKKGIKILGSVVKGLIKPTPLSGIKQGIQEAIDAPKDQKTEVYTKIAFYIIGGVVMIYLIGNGLISDSHTALKFFKELF